MGTLQRAPSQVVGLSTALRAHPRVRQGRFLTRVEVVSLCSGPRHAMDARAAVTVYHWRYGNPGVDGGGCAP